jgi:hypothetical protein
MYRGENLESKDEEENYRKLFEDMFDQIIDRDGSDLIKIPLFSYPTMIDCMGIKP